MEVVNEVISEDIFLCSVFKETFLNRPGESLNEDSPDGTRGSKESSVMQHAFSWPTDLNFTNFFLNVWQVRPISLS